MGTSAPLILTRLMWLPYGHLEGLPSWYLILFTLWKCFWSDILVCFWSDISETDFKTRTWVVYLGGRYWSGKVRQEGKGAPWKVCYQASSHCEQLVLHSVGENVGASVEHLPQACSTRGVRELEYLHAKFFRLWLKAALEGLMGGRADYSDCKRPSVDKWSYWELEARRCALKWQGKGRWVGYQQHSLPQAPDGASWFKDNSTMVSGVDWPMPNT